MTVNNARGAVLMEALPAMGLLYTLAAALMLVAYLIFARVSIQYQSEQALYCAAQGGSGLQCQLNLQAQLRSLMPWGEVTAQIRKAANQWSVEVTWKWQNISFHIAKVLSPQIVLQPKALLW